jgi:membrane protein required for colicin V production
MTGFDSAVVAIVLVSAVLGLWRGLVYEASSLAGWVLAYLAARAFAPEVAPMLPISESLRMAAACIGLFIAVLIICSIAAWMLSKAIRLVGLGWMDAFLGFVFGMARGVLVVLTLVLLAGMTALPQQPFWRDAKLSGPLQRAALIAKQALPPAMARQLHY